VAASSSFAGVKWLGHRKTTNSLKWWGEEWVGLYLHSSTCLDTVQRELSLCVNPARFEVPTLVLKHIPVLWDVTLVGEWLLKVLKITLPTSSWSRSQTRNWLLDPEDKVTMTLQKAGDYSANDTSQKEDLDL